MPSERLSMRRIRELLRLKFGNGLPGRVIAASLGLSKGAVNDYLARAVAAGLSWPLPEELNDTALERRLFPGPLRAGAEARSEPQLGLCGRRAAAQGRDPLSALAGIPRRSSRRLRLFLGNRGKFPCGGGYARESSCDSPYGWRRRSLNRLTICR